MRDLELGDKGDDVRELQLLLNTQVVPRPKLTPDGDFGKRTHEAVVAFQRSKGLTDDGVVGRRTRAALGLKFMPTPSEPPRTPTASWMDVAIAELGVHEDSLPGQHNSRIVEYHQSTTLKATSDETAWCSSFVNWVITQSGRRGTNSAAAKSWIDWGAGTTSPTAGAVVVIKKKTAGFTAATGSTSGFHVGFFVSKTASHLRLLGGNQGDSVKYSNFALASYDVKAYRVPG